MTDFQNCKKYFIRWCTTLDICLQPSTKCSETTRFSIEKVKT